jgi:RNA polymerase sigma-70 factor (ECF subfamily)
MSLVEIGQEMDVSPEAVESLLARGRRGLKAKLAGVWRQLLDLEPDGSGE